MEFASPLIPGTLQRRYKRFLADVELADGRVITAHCANPGAMLGVADPGSRVWLEPTDDPKRKLKFSWKLIELPGNHLAGIDTGVPNRVVGEALREGRIPELAGYETAKPEQKYGQNSRIDFLLSGPGRPEAYVEVKNVHLMRQPGLAEFPDSVTARGAKHLDDLAAEAEKGNRAVMLYCIQRDDCDRLDLARDIDPAYGAAFDRAAARGVEALAYGCRLGTTRIILERPIRLTGSMAAEGNG
ncbi:MAG: DNA/RNA nuclease SfsA [Pseudomonadota bacterium]